MTTTHALPFTLLTVLFFSPLLARASDEKIDLKATPPVVQAAIKKFGGQVEKIEKAKDEGKTTFAVTLKKEDHKTECTFGPEGDLLSTETTLQESELPAPVASAIKDHLPEAKIKAYEKFVEGSKITYEVPYTSAKGEKAELVLKEDGSVVSNGPDQD